MSSQLHGPVTLPQEKELALPVALSLRANLDPLGAQKNRSLLPKIESRFSVRPVCILGVILCNVVQGCYCYCAECSGFGVCE